MPRNFSFTGSIPGNSSHFGNLSDCKQLRSKKKMNTPGKQRVLAISTLVGLAFMAACNNPPPSDQHLQEQAAQATENAKQASKEALAQARVPAANAARHMNTHAGGREH